LLATDKADQAIELLERAQVYPHNLGEGKLYGAQENNIFYFLGCAYEQSGDRETARLFFSRASTGTGDPTAAIYYNDQPPEMIFYQGLALSKLNRADEARAVFSKLVDYGSTHINANVQMDYFAVSLPDFLVFEVDLNARNRLHCHYLLGLGYLGLGDMPKAKQHFLAVLEIDANHLGAVIHLKMI